MFVFSCHSLTPSLHVVLFFFFHIQKQKAEEEARKQAEINALQKQLQDLRQLNNAKVCCLESAVFCCMSDETLGIVTHHFIVSAV